MNEITFTTGTVTYSAETAAEQPTTHCQQCTTQASGSLVHRLLSSVSEDDVQKGVETYQRLLCNLRKRAANNPSAKKFLIELLDHVDASDKEVEEQLKQDSCPKKPQAKEEDCKDNPCDKHKPAEVRQPEEAGKKETPSCKIYIEPEMFLGKILDQVQCVYEESSRVLGLSIRRDMHGEDPLTLVQIGFRLGLLERAMTDALAVGIRLAKDN